jgi:hypothetical protein
MQRHMVCRSADGHHNVLLFFFLQIRFSVADLGYSVNGNVLPCELSICSSRPLEFSPRSHSEDPRPTHVYVPVVDSARRGTSPDRGKLAHQ